MTTWRKASSCHANGTCVGITSHPQGVAIRDEKNPTGPRLAFTQRTWAAFTHAHKAAA